MTEPELKAPHCALVQVRIGNRTYDAIHNKACHTCTHPARREIEEKILQGKSYRSIAELYSGTDFTQADGTVTRLPMVSWNSIFQHFKNQHLPVEAAVLREVADQRARDIGQHYEEQTARIVDGYSFAQQVLIKTQQDLALGNLRPDVKDGLAAAKLIKEIEESAAGSVDAEAWSQAMTVYFETARLFMPEDMWSRFTTALAGNPILLAIQKRLTAAEDVMEAEIVEPEGTP